MESTPLNAERDADVSTARTQIRATIERARAAIVASRIQTLRSRLLISRADLLARTASNVATASAAMRDELRDNLARYVVALREAGTPPARMLILVKETVREATAAELDPETARALMDDMVRWSVDAYYHAA